MIVMGFGVGMKVGDGIEFEMKIGIGIGMKFVMEFGLEIDIGFGLLHMYNMKHLWDNESLVVSIWVLQIEVDTLKTTNCLVKCLKHFSYFF